MKITTLLASAALALTLSACGSDDTSSTASNGAPSGDGQSSGEDVSAGSGSGDTSFLLTTAADQLVSQSDAEGYEISDGRLTLIFGGTAPLEVKISRCQISRSVLDGIVPGEIDTIALKYADGTQTCEEVMG